MLPHNTLHFPYIMKYMKNFTNTNNKKKLLHVLFMFSQIHSISVDDVCTVVQVKMIAIIL